MSYEIKKQGDVTVVALSGDVDLESSPKVRTALLDSVNARSGVVVDMSAVAYIDSSGVASLVEAFQSARKANTLFALAAVSEPAMRVLELARLDQIFAIYATVEEGLAQSGH